jgi:hypothetical protein
LLRKSFTQTPVYVKSLKSTGVDKLKTMIL